METLTDLGNKYKTDKATDHFFTDKYDIALSKFRNLPVNLLEIGIYGGSSIKMWTDYFKDGKIYATDIENKKFLEEENITIDQGDQGNFDYISNIFSGVDFDIIIDDGGHRMDQQQITLSALLPRVKSGGVFILEDLHTSFMDDYWGNFNHPKDNSTLRMIMEIATKRFTDMKYFISLEQITRIQQQIKSIDLVCNNFVSGRHNSLTAIISKL